MYFDWQKRSYLCFLIRYLNFTVLFIFPCSALNKKQKQKQKQKQTKKKKKFRVYSNHRSLPYSIKSNSMNRADTRARKRNIHRDARTPTAKLY